MNREILASQLRVVRIAGYLANELSLPPKDGNLWGCPDQPSSPSTSAYPNSPLECHSLGVRHVSFGGRQC
jgi:hypothetical protein